MNFVSVMIFSMIGIVILMVGAYAGVSVFDRRYAKYTRYPIRRFRSLSKRDWFVIFGGSMVLSTAISYAFLYYGQASKTDDIEILNGQIVGKERERVSCSHDYQCNCRTVTSCSGSGTSQSCTTSTTCDTCYEHSHDYDWNLNTDIDDIKIDRIDRQGVQQPPRWTIAQNGEPVAISHKYVNWVKAVPDSLFHGNDKMLIQTYASQIPGYPGGIYDYHRINRVIANGVPLENLKQWNTDLSIMLREIGPLKQANIILIFTKSPDPNLANAIRSAWLGGKKNDITIVIGVPEYPKIGWAAVNAWTDKEIFKVQLRDALIELGEVDRERVMTTIHDYVKKGFVRKPMADYAYLESNIVIDVSLIVWMIITMIVIGGVFSYGTYSYRKGGF
jgi:hypothetical protein